MGCICEPCSDIPLNLGDMRNKSGYNTLAAILLETQNRRLGHVTPFKATNFQWNQVSGSLIMNMPPQVRRT
jgi:hypothetical protein